jgi:hypothetical protein
MTTNHFQQGGSYTPDMAEQIDTHEEILADRYGVPLSTAAKIAKDMEKMDQQKQAGELLKSIFSILISHSNLRVSLHGLLCALGADSLTGYSNQTQISKDVKRTRALVSHYTVGWRDFLDQKTFSVPDCTKFRKKNSTRQIYAKSATDPFTAAKGEAKRRFIKNRKQNQNGTNSIK